VPASLVRAPLHSSRPNPPSGSTLRDSRSRRVNLAPSAWHRIQMNTRCLATWPHSVAICVSTVPLAYRRGAPATGFLRSLTQNHNYSHNDCFPPEWWCPHRRFQQQGLRGSQMYRFFRSSTRRSVHLWNGGEGGVGGGGVGASHRKALMKERCRERFAVSRTSSAAKMATAFASSMVIIHLAIPGEHVVRLGASRRSACLAIARMSGDKRFLHPSTSLFFDNTEGDGAGRSFNSRPISGREISQVCDRTAASRLDCTRIGRPA